MSKGEAEKGSGDPATEEEKKREEQADEAICSACEHSGIKVSSWDDFEAWGQYVEGQLDEPQLAETAEKEVTEFARVFGKYLVIDKEEPAHVNVPGRPTGFTEGCAERPGLLFVSSRISIRGVNM